MCENLLADVSHRRTSNFFFLTMLLYMEWRSLGLSMSSVQHPWYIPRVVYHFWSGVLLLVAKCICQRLNSLLVGACRTLHLQHSLWVCIMESYYFHIINPFFDDISTIDWPFRYDHHRNSNFGYDSHFPSEPHGIRAAASIQATIICQSSMIPPTCDGFPRTHTQTLASVTCNTVTPNGINHVSLSVGQYSVRAGSSWTKFIFEDVHFRTNSRATLPATHPQHPLSQIVDILSVSFHDLQSQKFANFSKLMEHIADSTNNTNFASSAHNSEGSTTFTSTILSNATAFNDPNAADDAGNIANQQPRERRAAITLAFVECLLGVVECGVGVRGGNERAKRVGAKAIQNGAESARTVLKREDIAEGMIEEQLNRVVKLVLLLFEQRFWQSTWNNIKHYTLLFWILYVRPCVLVILGWFGRGQRVAQEWSIWYVTYNFFVHTTNARFSLIYRTRTHIFYLLILVCLDIRTNSITRNFCMVVGSVLYCVRVSRYVAFNYLSAHTHVCCSFK